MALDKNADTLAVAILQEHKAHIERLLATNPKISIDPSVLSIDPRGNVAAQLARIKAAEKAAEEQAAMDIDNSPSWFERMCKFFHKEECPAPHLEVKHHAKNDKHDIKHKKYEHGKHIPNGELGHLFVANDLPAGEKQHYLQPQIQIT
jgi:hypothetical protein